MGEKNIKRNAYVNAVAKENHLDYEKTYEIMSQIKKKFGVSYAEFSRNQLIQLSDKERASAANEISRKKRKRNDHAIKKIVEETGWTEEYVLSELERVKEKFDITPRIYWLRQLYKKNDAEIEEYLERDHERKETRIAQIMDESGWTRKKVKEHIAHCNVEFNIRSIEYYRNFRCWELTDQQLTHFAVDEDSRKLSKRYNKHSSILTNKQKFNDKFKNYLGRKFWVNTDTDFQEFKTFTEGLEKIFCKPLHLSMGIGTKMINIPKEEDKLKALYNQIIHDSEMLFEEYIDQHEDMNKVYSGSVNTVRLTTLQDGDNCHHLWSFVRFGNNGIIDNFHGGGMAAAVDVNTGTIISDAMNSDGEYFTCHPVTGIRFKGFQIPHWEDVLKLTDDAMKSQDDVKYVGWDIAICPDKAVLVEGNSTPQVGVYQSILAPAKVGCKPIYERFLH